MTLEQRQQFPFRLLTIAVFLGFLLPVLVTDGMFMDGLLYAVMSKNLAHDTGSFWRPLLTHTLDPEFYDHPPLVFGIQSLFFKMFGDAFWVERVYSFLTAIITALLISAAWKRIISNTYHGLGWLPVFFWLAIPLVHWSYVNNMLENTMAIFSILSFIFLYKSIDRNRVNYLWQIPAAIMLICAFFSKGFTGVFPLAFYGIHWLVFRQFSFLAMLRHSIVLVIFCGLFFLPFILYEPSMHNLTSYLDQQVVKGMMGKREVTDRTFIVQKLLMELSIVIFFVLIAWFISFRKGGIINPHKRHARFFLITALSASLPILISLKQSGFYALPSLPFFALAAAAYCAPAVKYLTARINVNRLPFKITQMVIGTGIIAIIVISVMQFGKTGRDKDKLHDIHLIIRSVDEKRISVCQSSMQDWSLHGYFMRYGETSLDAGSHNYFLSDGQCPDSLAQYTDMKLPLRKYTLYRKNDR